jgi:hypothetical protein
LLKTGWGGSKYSKCIFLSNECTVGKTKYNLRKNQNCIFKGSIGFF